MAFVFFLFSSTHTNNSSSYERHTKRSQKKRDTDTHTHILEVQSCHHTKRNQTNNKNMLTFHVKIDIINIYREKKKPKTKQREYSYLVVFC